MVTEQEVTTTTTTTVEEKYRVNAPESMQETFMSDSEDEGGECLAISFLFSAFTGSWKKAKKGDVNCSQLSTFGNSP